MSILKLLLCVLTLVVISVFLYTKFLESQRDIHELALNQQANIAGTRKEEETAVYRNNQTPHGLPLLTGLQIRQGFRIRNGNLRDIWSVVMSQKRKEARFIFYEKGKELPCDLNNLNAVFKRLVQFFTHNDCYNIGVAVPVNSYHGFVTCMASWAHGLTVHTFDQLPRYQPDNVDLLVVSESQLKFALMFKYKRVLVVSDDPEKSFGDGETVLNWSELGDLQSLQDGVYDYKYDPKYDSGTPLVDTHHFVTTSYTQGNFVSALASIVRSLPLGHEFTDQEKLLIGYKETTLNYWPKIMAIALLGGSVIIGNSTDSSFRDAIQSYGPTILATDPAFAKSLLKSQDGQGWIHSLKMQRALHLFSEGIFSQSAMLPEFASVRLIYIGDDGDSRSQRLTSNELTRLRVLCGARIISERLLSGVVGAVLSTNYYDYRVFSNDNLVNRGAASQSLEIKLFQYRDLNIEKRHGELCIRGFTVGKPCGEKELEKAIASGERVGSEGWMPTGVIGKFGIDGCFYED